jgi:hypothetical protein
MWSALGAAVAVWLGVPVTAPLSAPAPGGIYAVRTSQGDGGELRIARREPRMRSGSAIGVDWPCHPGAEVFQEAGVEGARIDIFGRFHAVSRTSYVDGTTAGVTHVDGRFVSRRLARGTVWGYSLGVRNRPCRIRQEQRVTFRAEYSGQTPR